MSNEKTNIDLKNARILICNDDGVDARGLEILEEVINPLCDDVWIVAPEEQKSGYSHAISLLEPMTVRKVTDRKFAISGTPADCVLVAMGNILKEKKPDLIISGINNGSNIAEDILYSGTIGVSIEAMIAGIPTISFSQRFNDYDNPTQWEVAQEYTKDVFLKLIENGWNKRDIINVNFPSLKAKDVKGYAVAKQAFREFEEEIVSRKDPRGKDYVWFGHRRYKEDKDKNSDINQLFDDKIVITPLTIDMTSYASMEDLEQTFNG